MKFLNFSSPFGPFTIVWKGKEPALRLQRIFLSDPKTKSEEKAHELFKLIEEGSSSSIIALAENIRLFLRGEEVVFELKNIDFTICSKVQEKVLQAEYRIPRGWVSTYKQIANHIGINNGARVVGNSLAKNPFPIIIPCHRAIKTSGDLGGYQGGINMKRKLLELEGIEFSERGKVITDRIYY
ncbi:MAG: methylated-DNA--[protein]-cysteine S-methyltransferase [Candidatus Hermodarchaeota archaeon]